MAAVLSLAMPLTAQFEGVRLNAYLDSVGVPTICYGETDGVRMGDAATQSECDAMLSWRLGYYSFKVWQIAGDLPEPTHAALSSFTYNVGVDAFANSTLRKKLDAGDIAGACNELPRWVYAGGKKLNGLIKRRTAERDLCLLGIQDERVKA